MDKNFLFGRNAIFNLSKNMLSVHIIYRLSKNFYK